MYPFLSFKSCELYANLKKSLLAFFVNEKDMLTPGTKLLTELQIEFGRDRQKELCKILLCSPP